MMYKYGPSDIRQHGFYALRARLPIRELLLIILWGIGTLFAFYIMRQYLLWPTLFVGSRLGSALPIAGDLLPLRFKSDGTFQLSIFEDLHFGDGEGNPPEMGWGPMSDAKSINVMSTILDTETPDLVILNGDLITGENTYLSNATDYLDMVVAPMVRRSVPWATTYGNHDNDYNLSTEALLMREQSHRGLAYTRSMVNSANAGVSNYYLPIYSGSRYSRTPVLILWFFDSKGGKVFQNLNVGGNQVPRPGVVDPSVVDWFTSTNAALADIYKKTIPSLAFVHIPTFATAAAQLTGSGIDNQTAPRINDDCCPAATQGLNEDRQYDGSDDLFMQALHNTTGLIAVFSGHDHGNDWCYKWDGPLYNMSLVGNGLNLCFGRYTGYGGYGSWARGSRQIRISETTLANNEVETWIRLEDETISGRVMLNQTYGVDRYPAVTDSRT